eukprot:437796-Rhodomonas_salina.1
MGCLAGSRQLRTKAASPSKSPTTDPRFPRSSAHPPRTVSCQQQTTRRSREVSDEASWMAEAGAEWGWAGASCLRACAYRGRAARRGQTQP